MQKEDLVEIINSLKPYVTDELKKFAGDHGAIVIMAAAILLMALLPYYKDFKEREEVAAKYRRDEAYYSSKSRDREHKH